VLPNFAYAIGLVFGTVFVHVGCTLLVLSALHSVHAHHWVFRSHISRASALAALVCLMSLAAFAEAALWAGFYVWVDALSSFQQALYFSLVTFTTLGYGDVTLDEQWRILGAFQAANGILMFGWTTALLVAVSQRVVKRRGRGAGDS